MYRLKPGEGLCALLLLLVFEATCNSEVCSKSLITFNVTRINEIADDLGNEIFQRRNDWLLLTTLTH